MISYPAFRRIVCFAVAFCAFGAGAARAQPRSRYNDALAREQKVRAVLGAADAPASVAADVHGVVAAYEALVRRFPASGYCDNALWQAGRLELDLFDKFGDTAERDAGIRLLRRLAAGYPSSRLAAQVPETLLRVRRDDADAHARARPAPKAATAADTPTQPAAHNAAPTPPSSNRIATIKSIRRSVLPDAVRIVIELDGEVVFHDERISDPSRVFVDLPGTRAATPLVDSTMRFTADADVVRQVRIGRHPNNTTRVVLDAAGVSSYSVYPLYGPFRLVIDCVRPVAADANANAPRPAPVATTFAVATPPRVAAPPPQTAPKDAVAPALARAITPSAPAVLNSRPLTRTWPRHFPSGTPRASVLLAEARSSAEPTPAVSPALAPPASVATAPAAPTAATKLAAGATTPPPKNVGGGLSIARQLGMGVSRIVIDAGHGGHDPGAKGRGVEEAELVLDVALRLEKLLQKVAGVETILTRRTDDFIPLPERTAIANREGADLFLSIHANASPNPSARGVETYFLNFANNLSAAAVAARENAASTLAMGEMPDIVKAIATSNKVDESRDFATHVQRAMADRLRGSNKTLKDLGVKQAPFVVLIGATMPAALAEISFVTNPQEARLLKSGAYRQKIAESLFSAIRKYQSSLKTGGTLALQ